MGNGAGFFQILRFFLRAYAAQKLLPAGQRCQHQIAVMCDHFFAQAFHIHRLLPKLGQLGQSRHRFSLLQSIAEAEQIAFIRNACHAAHGFFVHMIRGTGAGIQNGKCIAQGTIGQPCNQPGGGRGKLNALLPGNIQNALGNILRANAAKIIALAAA